MWMAPHGMFVACFTEPIDTSSLRATAPVYLLYFSFIPTMNIWNAKLMEFANIIGQECK